MWEADTGEEASGGGVGEEEVVVGAGAASDSPFWRRTGARRAAVPGVLTQTRVSVPSSSSSSSSKHLHAKAAVHGTGTSSTGPNPLTANAAAANQAKHNPPAAAAPAAAPHSSPHVLQHPANAVVSATVAPPAYNKEAVKRNKLEAALVQPVANLEEIRKLCWSGVPRDLRPKIWRLLLGISATHLERRAGLLSRKHAEYFELLPEFGKSDGRSEYESNMLKQIQRDVPRPHLQHAILQTPEVQQALTRMLFLWSLRHPVVGFVQGFNDLASVFFALYLYERLGDDWQEASAIEKLTPEQLLDIEADTFWSLSIIDGMQDVYTNERRGMIRMLETIKFVVSKVDPALDKHLENEQIHLNSFAVPWINNLLMRAFPLELVWRLYDTFFSETSISSFHPYVCAAFLTTFSSKLLQLPFQEAIMFIQNPPTSEFTNDDIELLLSQAYMYSSLFANAK